MNRPRKSVTTFTLTIATLLGLVFSSALPLNSQQLQKGISVDLAQTENALQAPGADEPNAHIVVITAEGRVFSGVNPMTTSELAIEAAQWPHSGDQTLYLKVDARARCADLENALEAAHHAGISAVILLTSQPKSSKPLPRVVPAGMEVRLSSPVGLKTTAVRVTTSTGTLPLTEVDGTRIPWDGLQGRLSHVPETDGKTKAAVLQVDGQLPFGKLVHVIDVSSAAGFNVFLPVDRD